MVTVTAVYTREQEVVYCEEYQVPKHMAFIFEEIIGEPQKMEHGKYKGCMCEVVGVE